MAVDPEEIESTWAAEIERRARRVAAFRLTDAPRLSYGMTMKGSAKASSILTLRIGAGLARSLSREAQRRHTTKSELAREILASGLAGEEGAPTLAQEARRQSLLVAERPSEQATLEFLEHAADTRGWE